MTRREARELAFVLLFERSFSDDTIADILENAGEARDIVADGKLPFLIGGEHLVTLPAFRAVQEKYPDVAVIHFDAHTDLREEYLGNRLSHATVIRRIWEIIGDGRIFQFGIRSGERAEKTIASHFSDECFRRSVEALIDFD